MIRYYKCATCGKKGIDSSHNKNRRFCCTNCADTYYRRQKGVGVEKEGRKLCMFNEGVECYKHNCGSCGWNPIVTQKRLEAAHG